ELLTLLISMAWAGLPSATMLRRRTKLRKIAKSARARVRRKLAPAYRSRLMAHIPLSTARCNRSRSRLVYRPCVRGSFRDQPATDRSAFVEFDTRCPFD